MSILSGESIVQENDGSAKTPRRLVEWNAILGPRRDVPADRVLARRSLAFMIASRRDDFNEEIWPEGGRTGER